ncbi:hypothetical protein [Paracoccus alcaliphilus]|uniref:hypothetical protein n=1 Tax=Paracoccus alcaliphilus TaxID=34002 RepID=UPI001FCDFBFB|nr:hypothetical protein [Paracoccus alcaliphilus]
MALVDPFMEGLIGRTGRSDIAKITKMIDEAVKAARIARRLNSRAGRRFEKGGKQVFGRKMHHQNPDHMDISWRRSGRFLIRPRPVRHCSTL